MTIFYCVGRAHDYCCKTHAKQHKKFSSGININSNNDNNNAHNINNSHVSNINNNNDNIQNNNNINNNNNTNNISFSNKRHAKPDNLDEIWKGTVHTSQ